MLSFPSSPTTGQEHTTGGRVWVFTGAVWAPKGIAFREQLTGPRTYYVRTDGSDSNSGLSNTAGGAFRTIQAAFDAVAALDLGIQAVTISVGNGSYTAGVQINKPLIGGAGLTIEGNTANPSACAISIPSDGATGCFLVAAGQTTPITIRGFALSNAAPFGCGVRLDSASRAVLSNMAFGQCVNANVRSGAPGAYVSIDGGYTVTGGAAASLLALEQGAICQNGGTVTVTGTPAFSQGWAVGTLGGLSFVNNVTFSGAATGPRYAVSTGGIVNTNGAGPNYLPGSTAGTNDGTGVYA